MCECKCFGCTRKSRIFLCFAWPQPGSMKGWGLRCDEKLIIRSDWQAAQSPRGDDSERGYDACHRRGAPRKSKILLRSTKSKLIFHKRQTASLVEAFLVALLGSDSWQRMCASTLPHTHSRMYLHPHSQTNTHTHSDLYKHLHAQKPQLISNARFMRLLCDLVLVMPQDVMASAERRVNCHAKQES